MSGTVVDLNTLVVAPFSPLFSTRKSAQPVCLAVRGPSASAEKEQPNESEPELARSIFQL